MRSLRLRRKKNKIKSIDTSGVFLKVSILKGRNLKDGLQDELNPYTVLRANGYRFSTYTVNQNDLVEWNTDFSISLANWTRAPAVSLIVWNKLGASKSYIGETLIPLSSLGLNENTKTIGPSWYKLSSTQTTVAESPGELQLSFSLGSNYSMDNAPEIWQKFIDNFGGADGTSNTSAKYNALQNGLSNSLSGGTSANSVDSSSDVTSQAPRTAPLVHLDPVTTDDVGSSQTEEAVLSDFPTPGPGDIMEPLEININALDISDASDGLAEDLDGFFKSTAVDEDDDADEFDDALYNSLTLRGDSGGTSADSYDYASELESMNSLSKNSSTYSIPLKQPSQKRQKLKAGSSPETFELKIDSSVLGIVFMDIESVTDLPPYKNMTRTNFDMDPFVLVSFGKKTFRTPYRRHTLNPVYNERVIFPVNKLEKGFSVQFSVVDKDRLTLNDFIAETDLPINDILATAPVPGENGLYDIDDFDYSKDSLGQTGQKTFSLPLRKKKQEKWVDCRPWISLRASFRPYNLLRQQLWRALAKHYDADDNGGLNYTELTMLLACLNSTLTENTKRSFYLVYGKNPDLDELTIDEVVLNLERQILKDSIGDNSATNGASGASVGNSLASSRAGTPPLPLSATSSMVDLSASATNNVIKPREERVVRIAVCPFCNRPRLTSKAEIDIVTHLATCASQNSAKMDALVMGSYVTPSQAMKRWYTKVVSKVSYGNYRLGANSANILVQDRITGHIQEEKMSAYVRVGMRLLYKGIRSSRMEGKRIRNLLKSLSIKQGRKFDSPDSVQSIRPFIKFHSLDTTDILEPLDSFKNFNEFFYRKLKPDARPCEAPDNQKIAVSAGDCRLTVFATIKQSQEIWIKGRNFSISKLIGPVYPEYVDKYTADGSLAIFRLAPQDYHRFHSPVDGIVGEPKEIAGEYYTVNPMAVRSALDIYTENVRVIVPIDSPEFGKVIVCCIGAMMVGSTVITAKPGQQISRTDELGYFKFGGSTLVVLFEPDKIVFDTDLAANSESRVETLVRVGMSIGHKPEEQEPEHHYKEK